jgi:hypothetical protein
MGKINEFKLPNAENKKDKLDNKEYKKSMDIYMHMVKTRNEVWHEENTTLI